MSRDVQGVGRGLERKPIPALTGIRGVAACWVVAYHAVPLLGPLDGLPSNIMVIDAGYLAVDLFFVLSGFVLVAGAAGRFRSDWQRATRWFVAGRLFRILPPNALALAFVALLCPLGAGLCMAPPDHPVASFAASLFLVQAWWPGHSNDWNYPAWSLSAEWFAYAMFPVFILLLARVRGRVIAALFALASIAALAGLILATNSHSLSATGGMALPRCALEFFAGGFLFKALQKGAPISTSIWTGLSLLGIGVLSTIDNTDLFMPVLFGILIAGCFYEDRVARLLFGNRLVFWIGKISFSIYLLHAPLLAIAAHVSLETPASLAPLVFPLFAVALLVVSALFFQFVELPFHRLGKAWQERIYPTT